MFKFKIEKCPQCAGTDFGTGYQMGHGGIGSIHSFKGSQVFHIICTNCGTIVHSYVEKPENFKIKKKD